MLGIVVLLSLLTAPVTATDRALARAEISVIIDDVGTNQSLGLRAAQLPQQVALSILPHTAFSKELAVYGHRRGMDILLHQPMESIADLGLLGPGALMAKMDQREFSRILEDNLSTVPYVIGLNNHMGSLLTANPEKMNWLMAELKSRAIFFIDSRTTTATVAATTAEQWQVPAMSRKVFLDHYDSPEQIAEQFQRLIRLAEKFGHATAIGHPRVNTLQFLERALPRLEQDGIKLVPISQVMRSQYGGQIAKYPMTESTMPVHFYENCYNEHYDGRASIRLLQKFESEQDCKYL